MKFLFASDSFKGTLSSEEISGLLAASALLTYLAPFAETTFQHVFFRRMGICCIESALASLASVLAAAAIGEAALGQYSR